MENEIYLLAYDTSATLSLLYRFLREVKCDLLCDVKEMKVTYQR
jgi:hypothetical protein